jgi:hypothetical protein
MIKNEGEAAATNGASPQNVSTSAGVDKQPDSTAPGGSQDGVAIALVAAAVGALRKHAAKLHARAQDGASSPEGHSPAVSILSPEAAAAVRWAGCYEAIAADLVARPPQ